MITALEWLRFGACLALVIAGIYWRVKRGKANSHRFLFPYIIAAGIAGLLPLAAIALELFVAYYSGAMYAFGTVSFAVAGPFQWLWVILLCLPILPAAGIVPAVGKRPILMACLGLFALLAPILSLMWN